MQISRGTDFGSSQLAQFKAALDEHSIVATTDARGTITSVNDKFCEISKYSRDDLLGNDHRMINSGYHPKAFIHGLWQTIASHRTWKGHMQNRAKDGSLYWVDTCIVPIVDADGKIKEHIAIRTDITDQKLAMEKLRQQAALLDGAHDAILMRDLNHTITSWNKGAERLYGYSAAEAIGTSHPVLLKVDRQDYDRACSAVVRNDEWSGEMVKWTKTGARRTLDCRWTLLRNSTGKPSGIMTIDMDVTERKKAEAQFLRIQRMESIGTLAGGVAHDLNNLLSPILLGTTLIRQKGCSPEVERLVHVIDQSAKRGALLVRQVLTFARGVEGARVPIDFTTIATEVDSIVRDTFPKNITLELDIPRDIHPFKGDPTQIHQVLLNLCVNSRDAMPTGGCIKISAQNFFMPEVGWSNISLLKPGHYTLLVVSDNGSGMPAGLLDKIFDPFFTTKAVGQGTGLGLATVHTIVRSHGGQINVYSELGKGTSFKIYLPNESEGNDLKVEQIEAEDFPRGNGEAVLVIDDESSILEITKQTLESFNYNVLVASNGAQAVSIYAVNRDKIKVVLTDMMMPIMDGPSTIIALKQIDPNVIIIASSGLDTTSAKARAQALGVSYFLHKPFTAGKVLKVIQGALRGDEAGAITGVIHEG